MTDVHTTYDSLQHCTALKESRAKLVSMDCPYTGMGEEFSPTNLVEAALGGCMLLAMGAIGLRHEINLSGARVDVDISTTDMGDRVIASNNLMNSHTTDYSPTSIPTMSPVSSFLSDGMP